MKRFIPCVLALLLMAAQGAAQELPEQPIPPEPQLPDLPPADNIQGVDPSVEVPPELPAQEVPEYRPPAPEVPMISLPPEELPEPKGPPLSASDPRRPFRSYNSQRSRHVTPPPAEPDPISAKLPPSYTARPECLKEEEEVEDGVARFGIQPQKVPMGDQWVELRAKVCRWKGNGR